MVMSKTIKKEQSVYEVRSKMVNYSLFLFCFFGLITHTMTTIRALKYGINLHFILTSIALLSLLLITIYRKRVKLEVKLWYVMIIASSVTIASLIYYGFFAISAVYIIGIPVFFSFLVSRRIAIIISISFILFYFSIGYLYSKGILSNNIDADYYVSWFGSWLNNGFAILLTSLGLLHIGYFYSRAILNNYHIAKEKNKDLENREKKFRMLFESSKDAIILIRDNTYFDCNSVTLEMFACERSYLIGKHPSEFSPENQPNGRKSVDYADKLFNQVYSGEPQFFEWQHTRPDGSVFDAQISLSLVELDEDIYTQAIIRDITEQKTKDRELEKYRQNLEKIVGKRTFELEKAYDSLKNINAELEEQKEELQTTLNTLSQTQTQLIEKEKIASLGLLTSGIAHEINNPLNFIKTGLYSLQNLSENEQMLKGKYNIEETRLKVIKGMEDGVARIHEIVKTINHFNKSSNLTDENCYINKIIDNCIYILNHETIGKINIVKNYDNPELIIKGNDGKLHQLFLNILKNSIQAINKKGNIVISTKSDKNEKKLLIEIEDNGQGITEKAKKRIFEPFFTTKESAEGSGLGLFIAYQIIKEHKGEIFVDSEENLGTKINILLPL
jgi:PAS domain S-box-containing protein